MTKKLVVRIESSDGDTKHMSDFSLDDASELERIIVIQNIFKIMGVDSSIADMLEDYVKIGRAYHDVAASKQIDDPLETESTQSLPLKYDAEEYVSIVTEKREENKEDESDAMAVTPIPSSNEAVSEVLYGNTAMAMAFAKLQQARHISDETRDTPDHFKTGIKHTPTGDRYQCRFHCEKCGYKKTYYIKPNDKRVYCQNCKKSCNVRPAKKSGHLVKDAMHNFFIAGAFIGEDEQVNSNLS